MDPLTGVETSALNEGVKFLYQQASEILRAWRERRRDRRASPPSALESPAAVRVERVAPLSDPTGEDVVDALQELKDLVEPIKDAKIDPQTQTARIAIAALRDLLEVIVGSPITFRGEPVRAVDVSNVDVVAQRVAGQVRGVRADLAKLEGASIRTVRVRTGDVEPGAEVSGVELT